MDTEKTALTVAAAMAAVIIEPEKRSRMTISFCVAVLPDITAMKFSYDPKPSRYVGLAECISVLFVVRIDPRTTPLKDPFGLYQGP
jgi:hypothetical protein